VGMLLPTWMSLSYITNKRGYLPISLLGPVAVPSLAHNFFDQQLCTNYTRQPQFDGKMKQDDDNDSYIESK